MKNKAIKKPIIQAVIITSVFYILEIIFVLCDVFPVYDHLLIADIILRIIGGIIGLKLLSGYSERGESKYTVKQLFTNKIPRKTWLVMIPLIIYILLPFVKLVTATVFSTRLIVTVTIVIIQQFATGFFEEGVQRGLMMNGLIKHNTDTVKQRIFTVVIDGLFFGLGHFPNIVFGENPLIQMPSCFCFGIFIAAVYMLSDNLLLVMLLHAFDDSTFRIVKGFFGFVPEAPICKFVDHARNVTITYILLPLMAIYICVNYEKLKSNVK